MGDLKQNAATRNHAASSNQETTGIKTRPRKPPMMSKGSSLASSDFASKSMQSGNSMDSRPRKPPIRKNVTSKGPLLRLFVKMPMNHQGSKHTPEIVIWQANDADEISRTLDTFCSEHHIDPEFWKENLHDTVNRLLNVASKRSV